MNPTPFTPPGETLEGLLAFLNLPHDGMRLQALLTQAVGENLSHEAFLTRFLSEEAATKFSRQVQLRIQQAKLPLLKTLESFDFASPSAIPKAKVLQAMELGFLERQEGLIFLGPSGVGKTHLAIALAHQAASRGKRVLFTRAVDMINHLIASQADHSVNRAMKVYTVPLLLVIDEVGHLPFDQKGGEHFFNVISYRYERGSVVLTTNRPFKDWGKIFHDNTLAAAIVDRLAHHSDVIKIEGASYRVKDRKAQGPLTRTT